MPTISRRFFNLIPAFLILYLSAVTISSAAEITVFGPKKYMRTKCTPNKYSGNFTGLFTDEITSGKLIILNGRKSEKHKIKNAVSSAEIYVNGKLIFSPDDFKKNIYRLEAAVAIQKNNSFYIKLKGAPGSYITFSFVQDIGVPFSSLNASPEAIKVNEDSVLSWDSSLALDCSVEPDIGGVDCNGSITVSPDDTTSYTFTATGPGGTATSSAIIIHINSQPTSYNGSFTTYEDTPFSINLEASDPDNDFLAYNIISSTMYGALSGEAPSFTYYPETNYNGEDYLTFNVNDGSTDSNTATIQINVIPVNDVPVANAGSDQTVFRGNIVYLDGSQSSDIDGDPLSYQWVFVSTPPLSSISLIDPASSNPSFLAEKTGSYEITLNVNDGIAESLPDTVIITANPRIINVPNVVGMSQLDAESTLIGAGLIVGSITENYDEAVPEDHIVSQDPSPGVVIEEGSAIDLIVSIGPNLAGQGQISGKVLDALTGSVLSGISITLYMELDVGPDKLISQYTTQPDGIYIFSNLAAGDYLIKAILDGYIQTENRVTLASDDSSAQENIILSPLMDPGEIRIIVTWGESPADLESHLTAPNTQGCRYHCFYDTKEIPGANLDLDDMNSYGPETITITSLSSGTYRYYVHDFTDRMSNNSKALALSGARVRVYFGSGAEPMEFYVPNLAGTVWHVFDIDSESQQITPVNIMGFQDQPGEIDFPVITSSPVIQANLAELYTYNVQAKDPDNEALTYSLVGGHPDGMNIDPLTGKITWTPGETQGGIYNIIVKVTDGGCGEDTQTFQINVTYLPVINSFYVTPCSGFNKDGNITLTWSTDRAETVSINQGIGVVAASGSIIIPSLAEPVVYTLTAQNGSGQQQATAPKNTTGAINVSPDVLPAAGGTATLAWDFPCAVNCTIDNGIGEVPSSGSYVVNVSSVPIRYTITAINASGAILDDVMINKECADPIIIQMKTDPVCSWSPGEPVTISWTNTSGCVTHCEIDQGIGDVSSNGSIVVTPNQTTTYTLFYSGPEGAGQTSITVPNILPSIIKYFYASPSAIPYGQSTKLCWATQCAETSGIDQGIGSVSPNGNITVTPSSLPVTYTLSITGKGETIARSLNVNAKVNATFTATPSTIKIGEPSTLSWTTVNANYCEIMPGIGEVPLNGTLEVTPPQKMTYTLYASGDGDYVNRSVTVQYVATTAQLLADKENISKGESVTLSWIFSNASSCSIDQGIGEIQQGQSVVITPQKTTTYKMMAKGPGGTAYDSITITVLQPPAISIVQPDGIFDKANQYYTIKWTDEDADSNASILFYYDTDDSGADGTLIVSGILEDPDPAGGDYDKFIWDTSEMPEGSYYVYAVINDGYHPPMIDYSEGPVDIDHSISAFKLKPSDGESNDNFGISVELDHGYAIVGASQEDDRGTNSGAIYIFKQEDESWIEQAKLKADDAEPYDYFGCSVSLSGEYAAVGAYGDDDHGSYSGAVYIFKRDGEVWSQQIKITAAEGAAEDYFGISVSIDGDLLVIGAKGDDESDSDSGAAYIYKRDGLTWSIQKKLFASDAYFDQKFGRSVEISKDKVIVGTDAYSPAYIFRYDGTDWVEVTKLNPSNSESFQIAVSIDEDNSIIGSPYEDNIVSRLTNSGAGHVFNSIDSIWNEKAKLEPQDLQANDYFGSSVSLDGTYALIGSTGDDDGGTDSGSVYLYKGETDEIGNITSWTAKMKLTASDSASYANFGKSVSLNDGYALIGAFGDDDNGSGSGSAYIYPLYLGINSSAYPKIIEKGGSTILSWTSVFADSCNIEPDVGPVGLNGSVIVSPSETTIYVITAVSSEGSVSENVTVTVVDPAILPSVNISASPTAIGYNDSSTLSWSSFNAIYSIIEPDIGTVPVSGSIIVSPTQDTTYTIRAINSGGESTASVTVSVICYDPIIAVDAEPASIELGGSATITWNTTYADYCEIQPGVGLVDANGSITVSPEDTTTYILTATGHCGTGIYNIPIYVTGPTSIDVIYPNSINQHTDQTCKIRWTDTGPNIDATISLYYDTDNSGADGTLIVSGLNETLDGDLNDSYSWDTSEMPEGTYYIYGILEDGVNPPLIDYSEGPVNIIHSIPEKLKVSGSNYYELGYSVAISGDYAIASDSVYPAYIFKQNGSVWIEQARLITEDLNEYGYQDNSVSINGDYAIVGVYNGTNNFGVSSGTAYIFVRQGDTWIEQAKIMAGDGEQGDYFGCSVSINGDYAIVGAKRVENWDMGKTSGAAYIFKREGSLWIEQAKLLADDGDNYDFFGYSVSISGDYAIVGANADDKTGSGPWDSGSAYLFKRDGASWIQLTKLTASDAANYENFGTSVSIDGGWIIIGAPSDYNSGYYSGAVYVFNLVGNVWTEKAKLTPADPGPGKSFGCSVDIKGNLVIIGADYYNGSGTESAYIFQYNGVNWNEEKKLVREDTWNSFGTSVAISENYSLVGAYGDNDTGNWSGALYFYPLVSVDMIADPETIQSGGSAILSWSSMFADSCIIEPDIGTAAANGSVTVSPSETTTYTIIASGKGITISDHVTLIVEQVYPLPDVTLSSEPQTINSGSSSVLTWTSQYATACTIEPSIGIVDTNGSVSVWPTTTTIYTITATGPGGNSKKEITVWVNPSNIIINSPINGTTVYAPDVLLEGSIVNQTGEVGVTVNGVVAFVDGDYFAANNVPLEEGSNNITITVNSADGNTTTLLMTVYYQPSDTYITMSVDEESGVAPFETALKIGGTFTFASEPVITYTGPDDIVITDTENNNEYLLAITTPGLYFLTAEADYEGTGYSDTIAVLVMDKEALDALLKAKWNGMRSVLSQGNISSALGYIAEDAREMYEYNFNLLSSHISEITSLLRDDIEMEKIRECVVDYEMSTDYEGEIYICLIRFIKDKDGIWRISFF
jgi:hypothetical protein